MLVSMLRNLSQTMPKTHSSFLLFYKSQHFLLLLLLTFLLLTSESFANGNQKWRLEKNEEGIQVYLRDTVGSALKSFKGTMTIKSSLSSLLKVIKDTDSYPRWLHNCQSAKNLKQNGNSNSINYVVTNMPWPVADRDLVVASSLTQNKSTKRIEIKLQAKPKFLAKVAGKVRIEKMNGRWLLTPTGNDNINVIYEMSIDPGGNIPKWVVNSMALDLPFYTLRNLRKIVKEDKYLNAKIEGILEQ